MAGLPSTSQKTKFSEEDENGYRITKLLSDLGRDALSEILKTTSKNTYSKLSFEEVLLDSRVQGILRPLVPRPMFREQWETVFREKHPNINAVSVGDIKDFDITLIVLLLKRICTLVPTDFKENAQNTDVTDDNLETYIGVLVYYRNHMAHLGHGQITAQEFKITLHHIKQAILGIKGILKSPTWPVEAAEIDRYETIPISAKQAEELDKLRTMWLSNNQQITDSLLRQDQWLQKILVTLLDFYEQFNGFTIQQTFWRSKEGPAPTGGERGCDQAIRLNDCDPMFDSKKRAAGDSTKKPQEKQCLDPSAQEHFDAAAQDPDDVEKGNTRNICLDELQSNLEGVPVESQNAGYDLKQPSWHKYVLFIFSGTTFIFCCAILVTAFGLTDIIDWTTAAAAGGRALARVGTAAISVLVAFFALCIACWAAGDSAKIAAESVPVATEKKPRICAQVSIAAFVAALVATVFVALAVTGKAVNVGLVSAVKVESASIYLEVVAALFVAGAAGAGIVAALVLIASGTRVRQSATRVGAAAIGLAVVVITATGKVEATVAGVGAVAAVGLVTSAARVRQSAARLGAAALGVGVSSIVITVTGKVGASIAGVGAGVAVGLVASRTRVRISVITVGAVVVGVGVAVVVAILSPTEVVEVVVARVRAFATGFGAAQSWVGICAEGVGVIVAVLLATGGLGRSAEVGVLTAISIVSIAGEGVTAAGGVAVPTWLGVMAALVVLRDEIEKKRSGKLQAGTVGAVIGTCAAVLGAATTAVVRGLAEKVVGLSALGVLVAAIIGIIADIYILVQVGMYEKAEAGEKTFRQGIVVSAAGIGAAAAGIGAYAAGIGAAAAVGLGSVTAATAVFFYCSSVLGGEWPFLKVS